MAHNPVFDAPVDRGAFFVTTDGAYSDDPYFAQSDTKAVFYRHPQRIGGQSGYWGTDVLGEEIILQLEEDCWSMTNRGLVPSLELEGKDRKRILRSGHHRNWQMTMTGPSDAVQSAANRISTYLQLLRKPSARNVDRPSFLDAFLDANPKCFDRDAFMEQMHWLRSECDFIASGLGIYASELGFFHVMNGTVDFVSDRLKPLCAMMNCEVHFISKDELPADWRLGRKLR